MPDSRFQAAAVVRVLLSRDTRSVHALVPGPCVRDWGFHDVTILDYGWAGLVVPVADLSLLQLQWPVSRS